MAVQVGQEPGRVRRDADTGVAELVGGVLRGRGAEHRAAPRPRGGGQDPGLAGPGRAGDHLDGPGRGEHVPDRRRLIQPQPAARGLLARVLRALAQLRLQQRRVGAQAPRRQLARQPRRALRLRVRDQPLLGRQLRGGGVPRGARPRVDAAPVQLPAQRRRERRPLRRLQAHHIPAPPGQGLLGQAEQQLLRRLRAHPPGLRRHHQGQLLEQVVPGPGGLLLRHQRQRLLPPPGPAPRATAARRPRAIAGCWRGGVRAARVRHRGRDARQLAAERGVPPRGQRVPVDARRVLALA